MIKECGLALCGMVLITLFSSVSVKDGVYAQTPENVKNIPSVLGKTAIHNYSEESATVTSYVDSMYRQFGLKRAGLSEEVFYTALRGYHILKGQGKVANQRYLTICDYSQPSIQKRLYVLDLQQGRIAYHSFVAHGRNTGATLATSFSNSNESHKSSLGFMITGNTYMGGNGYSMQFEGMEKGINCQVRTRAIVMHGSDYVNASRAVAGSMMGRSWGCPAVPLSVHRQIINDIKGGSVFFAYHPDASYVRQSSLIRMVPHWPVLNKLPPANLASNATVMNTISGRM